MLHTSNQIIKKGLNRKKKNKKKKKNPAKKNPNLVCNSDTRSRTLRSGQIRETQRPCKKKQQNPKILTHIHIIDIFRDRDGEGRGEWRIEYLEVLGIVWERIQEMGDLQKSPVTAEIGFSSLIDFHWGRSLHEQKPLQRPSDDIWEGFLKWGCSISIEMDMDRRFSTWATREETWESEKSASPLKEKQRKSQDFSSPLEAGRLFFMHFANVVGPTRAKSTPSYLNRLWMVSKNPDP